MGEVEKDEGVSGGVEGEVQGGAEVWGGEGMAWVEAMPVCGDRGVCDSGHFDGDSAEFEADGEVVEGGEFQGASDGDGLDPGSSASRGGKDG